MKEKFLEKKFSTEWLAVVERANAIIAEYQRQGFTLTLRQLYYQFVARALIPNKVQEYKRLGAIVNDGRMAGLIDWDAIEDRTRNLRSVASWDDPASIVAACGAQFKLDLWRDQEVVPEVWIEKDALVGVVEPACTELRVPYFACRGYTSQSEQYAASKRLALRARRGQGTLILHLGDHDPSGIDMSRDNADRMTTFLRGQKGWRLVRIALNMDQVEQYSPPPNPAKATDARFNGYQEKYGDESWELDALEPTVIDRLIREHVEAVIDDGKWGAALAQEEAARETLTKAAGRWDEITDFVNG